MELNRKMARWQFPLWSLLIIALLGPPIIAGAFFLLREVSAPFWAIGLSAAQIVVWLIVLFVIVRSWLPNPRALRKSKLNDYPLHPPIGGRPPEVHASDPSPKRQEIT